MNKNSALITGSAKRIGKEIALNLASKGFDIAISYNNSQNEAQQLSKEIQEKFNVQCEIFQCDLSKKDDTKKLIDKVLTEFPNLNLLINNASIFNKSNFFEDESELENNFAIHFLSPQILCKEFAKNILAKNIKNAQIINFCDKNIARFETQYFYYLLSKKLLAQFTKMLALQLAPEIRVNAIAPGFIIEDIYMQENPEIAKKVIEKIPLKRKGEVKNIIQTLNFLIENDFISGQILSIDGAASLNHAG